MDDSDTAFLIKNETESQIKTLKVRKSTKRTLFSYLSDSSLR